MAMVSSRLVFLVSICILVSQAIAQPDFLYHFCLDEVLAFLSSNTEIDYGFYNFSYGKSPDKVYSLGLCRGDVKPDLCRSCLNKATDLPLRCPNQKEAIGWYYYCMLRYSFRDIFGILEISPPSYLCKGNDLSANYDQFCQDLRNLLDSQRGRAAAGGSLRKFAAGNATAPDNQTLYSLVQCTPDLSDQDCSDCLFGAMEDVRNYCSGIQRGSVFKPSCNLRKPREKPQSEFGDEIRSVESLQLGFGTIKVATYDFSDANKLGQAGFGVVYK
ncbi:cysteine-rich receptor-like protein kinase 29, partial [Quercus suber]